MQATDEINDTYEEQNSKANKDLNLLNQVSFSKLTFGKDKFKFNLALCKPCCVCILSRAIISKGYSNPV